MFIIPISQETGLQEGIDNIRLMYISRSTRAVIINSFLKFFFFFFFFHLCDIQKKTILCAYVNILIAGEQRKLFINTKARNISYAISWFHTW